MTIRKLVAYYLLVFFFSLFIVVAVSDLVVSKTIGEKKKLFSENDLGEFVSFLEHVQLNKDTAVVSYYFDSHIRHYKNLKLLSVYKDTNSFLLCLKKKHRGVSEEFVNLFDTIDPVNDNFQFDNGVVRFHSTEGDFHLIRLYNHPSYYLGVLIDNPPLSKYTTFLLIARGILGIYILIFIIVTARLGVKKYITANINKIGRTIEKLERNKEIQCNQTSSFEEFDEVCKQLNELSLHMRKRYEKYYQDSIHDPLTGAYNLRKFYEDIESERKNSMTTHTGFVLLIIDVDNFKQVNDTLGHLEGDKTLKEVVYVIKRNIRDSDAVYRYGGDEFTVILKNLDEEGAYRIAERIRREVEKNTFTTVSIGGSHFYIAYTSIQLMREADRKLYIAKKLGKNRSIILWEDTEDTFRDKDEQDGIL